MDQVLALRSVHSHPLFITIKNMFLVLKIDAKIIINLVSNNYDILILELILLIVFLLECLLQLSKL